MLCGYASAQGLHVYGHRASRKKRSRALAITNKPLPAIQVPTTTVDFLKSLRKLLNTAALELAKPKPDDLLRTARKKAVSAAAQNGRERSERVQASNNKVHLKSAQYSPSKRTLIAIQVSEELHQLQREEQEKAARSQQADIQKPDISPLDD